MPKIRTNRTKPPPEGFEDIEGVLDEYERKMRDDYADANLIAKWKRTGFEGLCCARCVQSRDMNYAGSVCICRVPKANLKPGTVVECVHCESHIVFRFFLVKLSVYLGCRGCASGD
ncbi:hypothetical protein PSTT_15802 [Puccinia striiformis]|uniref:Protein BUD31 n=1 Tax=Puccinia striiformis TaxID=27350 RepID=A0A2S4UFS7_9BASI|nr:hypothetical protein PSTT_15802 [Puccinia striiformis]